MYFFLVLNFEQKKSVLRSGMRIWSDPLILGLPDPVPTCNNGYKKNIKKNQIEQNISQNQQILAYSYVMHTYLNKNILFSFRIKVGSGSDFFKISGIRNRGEKNFGSSSLHKIHQTNQ